ncbi:MAG: hypothetical protein AAF318_18315 [Pseudomonadota bacterium]
MIARAVQIGLTALCIAAMVVGWQYLGLLRGTLLWDLRHVTFAAATVLVFSLAAWLCARIFPG